MHVLIDDRGCLTLRRLRPWHRVLARCQAARLDRELDDGTSPEATMILAARAMQLTSMKLPRDMAVSLQRMLPAAPVRPQAPQGRLRTIALPARLPHTIQLCIHCQERPAGFWVSRTDAKTARRPWCLSCCEGLDQDCCVIPFDS
jgi:hypothetical protein